MLKSYKIDNVKCEGCVNSIKKELFKQFKRNADVDLSAYPRVITFDVKDDEEEKVLLSTLKKLGYPLSEDKVSKVEEIVLKGKSFVSCAAGKFSLDR